MRSEGTTPTDGKDHLYYEQIQIFFNELRKKMVAFPCKTCTCKICTSRILTRRALLNSENSHLTLIHCKPNEFHLKIISNF